MWFDKIQPFSKIKIYFVFVVKYIGDNVHNSITKMILTEKFIVSQVLQFYMGKKERH